MVDVFSLDEDLICALCRDIFVEPVTLPCGHNFCEECVDQLKRSMGEVASSYYTCPLCLAPCDINIDFKKNVVLHNIIEKYHRMRSMGQECSVCKGQRKLPAEKTCLHCEESYCTLHIMAHFENNILRQHVLVNPISNISRLCKSHGKELELYCQTDDTALCAYCMLPAEAKHTEGHNVIRLTDATINFKEKCQDKLSSVQMSLSNVNQCLLEIEDAAEFTKKNVEDQRWQSAFFLRKIKLFLDMEEQAWDKRFSVDLVQDNVNQKHRADRLMNLMGKLLEAQDSLKQALTVQDPLLLLQTIQNTTWENIYEPETCSHQIQEVKEWSGPKPVAMAKITPLLQTLRRTFSGADIKLNPESAHPILKLCLSSSSLWLPPGADHSAGPYCVLGQCALSAGVHHWEVVLESITEWTIGITYAPPGGPGTMVVPGKDESSWSLSYAHSKSQFCAEHDRFRFCFSAHGHGTHQCIGVFLDVDSGILSFYDVLKLECLHTFYCSLQAPVYPAFGMNVGPLNEGAKMTVVKPEELFQVMLQ